MNRGNHRPEAGADSGRKLFTGIFYKGITMRQFPLSRVAAGIILIVCCGSVAGAQSASTRDDKKIQVSKKTDLRIVRGNGITLRGKWRMETSDALCLRLSSGREVIVPKDDIARIYRCRRNTNFGFFVGVMSGFCASALFLGFGDTEAEDIYLAPAFIMAGCGLFGAVIGSLILSCEEVNINDLAYYGLSDGPVDRLRFGVQFNFRL